MTFTFPADSASSDVEFRGVIREETGTAYFDAMQVGKTASECESFADYVSWKEIRYSAVAGVLSGIAGVGAASIVTTAMPSIGVNGVDIGAAFIANLATGGNVSILQSVISLFGGRDQ